MCVGQVARYGWWWGGEVWVLLRGEVWVVLRECGLGCFDG